MKLKFKAEMALSLDVIFHLVEDKIFELYMTHLFFNAEKFVIIYSSDTDAEHIPFPVPHIKHRRFTEWVKENMLEWKLVQKIPNTYPHKITKSGESGSFSDFYIYEKIDR